jgi:hypothetical protein
MRKPSQQQTRLTKRVLPHAVETPERANFKNLKGRDFGRLHVAWYAGQNKGGQSRWLCLCSCGTPCVLEGHVLLRKRHPQVSCGCRKKKYHRFKSSDTEHRIWYGMVCRCYNQSVDAYADYGGRGIRVCRRWRESYEAFREDIGDRPSLGHQLGRIDNDGNYSCGHCDECRANGWPANCEWQTRPDNMSNTRRTVKITFDGLTLSMRQWSRRLGIRYGLIQSRVYQGWDPVVTLTTPAAGFPDSYTICHGDRTLGIKQWSVLLGIPLVVIRKRLARGLSSVEVLAPHVSTRVQKSDRNLTFRCLTLNVSQWCRRLGLPRDTVRNRLNNLGWDIERALTTPVRPRRRTA